MSFYRLKQRALESVQYSLGRESEATETLSQEQQEAERKIRQLKTVYEKFHVCAANLPDQREPSSYQNSVYGKLGKCLVEGGESVGHDTAIGCAFLETGKTYQKVGENLVNMDNDLYKGIVKSTKDIVVKDINPLLDERLVVENYRLDLDIAKGRYNSYVRMPEERKERIEDQIQQAEVYMNDTERIFNDGRNRLGWGMMALMSRESEMVDNLSALVLTQLNYFQEIANQLQETYDYLENLKLSTHVFGRDIEDYCTEREVTVPPVVEECVHYLDGYVDEPGIFRKSGLLPIIRNMRHKFNLEDPSLDLLSVEYKERFDCVSGVLKTYFRELPEPLILFELYPEFMKIQDLEASQRLQRTKELLQCLPQVNYETLKFMLRFLVKISNHSHKNKMEVNNLGIVFGPTFLRMDEEGLEQEKIMALSLMDNGKVVSTVTNFIKNYSYLFDDDSDVEVTTFVHFDPSKRHQQRKESKIGVMTSIARKKTLKRKTGTSHRQRGSSVLNKINTTGAILNHDNNNAEYTTVRTMSDPSEILKLALAPKGMFLSDDEGEGKEEDIEKEDAIKKEEEKEESIKMEME